MDQKLVVGGRQGKAPGGRLKEDDLRVVQREPGWRSLTLGRPCLSCCLRTLALVQLADPWSLLPLCSDSVLAWPREGNSAVVFPGSLGKCGNREPGCDYSPETGGGAAAGSNRRVMEEVLAHSEADTNTCFPSGLRAFAPWQTPSTEPPRPAPSPEALGK